MRLNAVTVKWYAGRNKGEITVLVKKSQAVFHAYRGDDAIDRLPDGLALSSAISVNLRRRDIGGEHPLFPAPIMEIKWYDNNEYQGGDTHACGKNRGNR